MKKKLLSMLLALCMVLTLLPTVAFAEVGETEPGCSCETHCTAESQNMACAVCGAEGAKLEDCAAPEPDSGDPGQPEESVAEAAAPAEEETDAAPQVKAADSIRVQATGELWLGNTNVMQSTSGSGYSYDASTNTLTLDNYKSETYREVDLNQKFKTAAYLYTTVDHLTIVIKGSCSLGKTANTNEYLRDSDDKVRTAGIVSASPTIANSVTIKTQNKSSSLTVNTHIWPLIGPNAFIQGAGTITLNSGMHGAYCQGSLTVEGGGSVTMESKLDGKLTYYGLRVGGSLYVQENTTLTVKSNGITYKGSIPNALYVEDDTRLHGTLLVESNGTNSGDGGMGRGLYTTNLSVFDGGVVKAYANGKNTKTNTNDGREAIYVTGQLGVASNGYVYAKTNGEGISGIYAKSLYIREEGKNGFAVITQPVRGKYDETNKKFVTLDGGISQTVEIKGLNQCTLYLRRIKASNMNFWYKTYSFSEEHVTDAYYDNTSNNAKFYDLANGQYAATGGTDPNDYFHLGHIEIQDDANLLLDDVCRTDLTDTFITVKAGKTLNLKLKIDADAGTGPSILHGNSKNPLIKVEPGATLNLITDSSNKGYASLSLINEGGPTIAGGGTVNVGECNLYTRGKDGNDIQANLTLGSKSYVDCTYFSGTLTMNGGALFGKVADNTTVKGVGSLELSNKPALKNENGVALYPAEVTLYDTEAQFSKAQLVTNIRTSPTATTPLHRSFLLITELGYGESNVKTGSIPVLFDPETQKHSTITVYLPENTRVAKALVNGVSYWSSAIKDQQIIAKKDGTGKGVLFVTGTLLLDGTMAFRQYNWVSLQDGGSGTVRQLCSDYSYTDSSRNYWIDYDEDVGITLKTPDGAAVVVGYDIDIRNGEHELMLNGLWLRPRSNSCAKVAGSKLLALDSTLTLKLINGTSNTLETQNGKPVFDLPGNLVITSETGKVGQLTLAGSGKAFGNTSAETSTLKISDSIVKNTCADKSEIELSALTISNSTVIGLGTVNCADIKIDGGSVDLDVPEGTVVKNSAGAKLTKQTFVISNITSQTKVDAITISGLPEGSTYNTGNIHTDDNGKISLWLPEGATVTGATIGNDTYYPVPDGNGGNKLATVADPAFTAPTEDAVLTLKAGESFAFRAEAYGVPTPGLKWQMSSNGTDWTDISGASGSSYTGTMTKALHGTQYRCVATNTYGGTDHAAYSKTFTLYYVPAAASQPQDRTVQEGTNASFSFALEDLQSLTGLQVAYQWFEKSNADAAAAAINGATASICEVQNAGAALDGNLYFCTATLTYPGGKTVEITGDTARLQVVGTPAVSAQPQSSTVNTGESVSFAVTAAGNYELRYQWQVKKSADGAFADIENATEASYTIPEAAEDMDGWQYRCIVTNAHNGVTMAVESDAAVLTVVGEPVLVRQPEGVSCQVGLTAMFQVEARGNQNVSYQWQVSADDGQTWEDIPDAVEASYTTPKTTMEMLNWLYRCVVTNSANGKSVQIQSESAQLRIYNGSGTARYTIELLSAAYGTLRASAERAANGTQILLTVTPDSGYVLESLTVTDKNGGEIKLTNRKEGEYSFTMPGSAVKVKASFAADKDTKDDFRDVPDDDYYYEPVKWAVEKDVTQGIGNGLFDPDGSCTRAQIVTFLWRAAGTPAPKQISSFSDVPADSYYAKAVAWAVENKITLGTDAEHFSPEDSCTRAQAVTFLFRAIGKTAASKADFRDVPADSYYADAVAWAVENGVTKGTGEGLFSPEDTCTRAQIVTFLYRAYQGK